MAVVSLRASEEDITLFKKYAHFHNITVSDFLKSAALEKIEEEHDLVLLQDALKEDDGLRFSMKEIAGELGFE